jgi:hypothetical protein
MNFHPACQPDPGCGHTNIYRIPLLCIVRLPHIKKNRKLSQALLQIPHNISELLSKKGINNFRLRSFILPCGFNDDILFTSLAAANPAAFQIPQTQ